MKKRTVTLDFEEAITTQLLDKHIREGLSSVARSGKYLWVAGDENISIQRLEQLEDGSWGKAVSFFLIDFIDLPSTEDEADIEGMDIAGNYLWIVGSHSYKRKKAREDSDDPAKEIDRLSRVKLDPNRNLLARIPLIQDEAGAYVLQKTCPDPDNPGEALTAARLRTSGKKWSQLSEVLSQDRHTGPFIGLPGKENGFDIEGLAAFKDKIFLGLRGPVLRGWALILEIQLQEEEGGLLKLKMDEESGEHYLKHFVNLHGMGIRDLAIDGDDILILAGPTMDLDGNMEVYRWKNGTQHAGNQQVKRKDIESLLQLPYQYGQHGVNKAEGLALMNDHSILLVYDSPDDQRKIGDYKVKADVYYPGEEEPG